MNFKLANNYKSLHAGLEWNDIPNFAIITGKNGTGKSHLLETMNGIKNFGELYFSQKEIKHIPPMHNFIATDNMTSSQYSEQKKNKYTQVFIVFKSIQNADVKIMIKESNIDLLKITDSDIQKIRQLNKNNSTNLAIINKIIENKQIFSAILEQTQHKRIEELTEEEFEKYCPIDFGNDFTSTLHLRQWFTLYIDDHGKKSSKAISEYNEPIMKKLHHEKTPWKLMNEILKKYDFKYQIVDFDPNIAPIKIEFTDGTDTVQIEDLSSGEQQIISLVAWAHHEIISQNIKLLLLDEPDAHLHPSFCEMFIKIMEEYVVEKYKIKVIMTTHSPSTIAHASNESIFVMDSVNPRIQKQDKDTALNTLSDGLMRLSEGSIVAIGEIFKSSNQHVLLCEGKTDKIHIDQAKILNENLKTVFENIAIVYIGGADNITALAPILKQMDRNSENTTVLFDGDEKGTKIKNKTCKDFRCIQLPQKDIESMTKLYEQDNSVNFKKWLLETYPNMKKDIDDGQRIDGAGGHQSITSPFNNFIKNETKESDKANNPLNKDNKEKASNVFKNLWCEYLKHHKNESLKYYKDLVDFLVLNIQQN